MHSGQLLTKYTDKDRTYSLDSEVRKSIPELVGQQIQLDVNGNIKYYEINKSAHHENDVTPIRTIYNHAETISIKDATMLQNVIEAINEINNDIKVVNKSEFWETGKGNELRTSNITHHESISCQYLKK